MVPGYLHTVSHSSFRTLLLWEALLSHLATEKLKSCRLALMGQACKCGSSARTGELHGTLILLGQGTSEISGCFQPTLIYSPSTFLLQVKYCLLEPTCITICEPSHTAVNYTRLHFWHLRYLPLLRSGEDTCYRHLPTAPSADISSTLGGMSIPQETKTHIKKLRLLSGAISQKRL